MNRVPNPLEATCVRATEKPTPALRGPTPLDPLLVNANGARAILGGISRTTLDKLVRKGEIRCVRLAGRVLFSVEYLREIAKGGA